MKERKVFDVSSVCERRIRCYTIFILQQINRTDASQTDPTNKIISV